ncbi:phospho-acceptor domain-containing protein [Zymomonas mobilis]|uniref:histidine kinase n=1 Tax=Zymomonas mobilis TaxID=542 RepID=A0A542W1X3_ZYMMB|nr:HAMP domain-containing sensor histidine kinase [Zymomonas mobilis]TQL17489.1 phospho-acceptor domain-containing protein [Zymomonas mobilis]
MRFDDMLQTIMDQPINTAAEKIAVWRQLVDCIAQDKGQHDPRLLKNAYQRLMDLTREVPTNIRIDTAETLAGRHIPPLLVQYFACDIALIAMPVISSVRLNVSEWIDILPALRQPVRNILRQRNDLDPLVLRALDSLGDDRPVLDMPKDAVVIAVTQEEKSTAAAILTGKTDAIPNQEEKSDIPEEETTLDYRKSLFEKKSTPISLSKESVETVDEPLSEDVVGNDNVSKKDMSFADTISSGVLHKAYRTPTYFKPFTTSLESLTTDAIAPSPEKTADTVAVEEKISSDAPKKTKIPRFSPFSDRWQSQVTPIEEAKVEEDTAQIFEFEQKLSERSSAPVNDDTADRNKDFAWFAMGKARRAAAASPTKTAVSQKKGKTNESDETQIRHLLARIDAFRRSLEARAEQFNFETDKNGVVIYVKGIASHILAGVSLATPALQNGYGVDGQAVGAFGRRAPIRHARLTIPGNGSAAGEWRISAAAYFDPETGHFSGYRGIARRPRIEETAQPFITAALPQPSVLEIDRDSLRQLMHELRNPLNAIVGFAEMIEHQMLGPVGKAYRYYASDITRQGQRLLQAVDDLNLAADDSASHQPSEPEGATHLTKIVSALHSHYQEAVHKYNGDILFRVATGLPLLNVNPVAVERIFSRLLAAVVGLMESQEQIEVSLDQKDNAVRFIVKRPSALKGYEEQALLDPGFNLQGEWPNSPVLGLGFTLRLVRNLASAINGQLEIKPDAFVILLPIEAIQTKVS